MENAPIQLRPLFIRRTQLREIAGISPSQVDRLERGGTFPKRRRVEGATVGWLYSEIESYLNSCEQVG
jgi:predicted DNA-binding transcriptional regulator AlpA